MASTPLTLAALATSAVPGLQVLGARSYSGGGEDEYTSAVVSTDDGEYIVRVPRTAAAEVRQSGELLGTAAIAEGARSALPFRVPETKGITRAGETRAVVSTFLTGERITSEVLEADALLLQPIAETIGAIHSLPISLVQQAGMPVRTTAEIRDQASRLVGRAADTRLLPETVHARWTELLRTPPLWDFAPTVIHGSLDAEQFVVEDERITGVLGWSELSVGDPAFDLAWLLTSGVEVLESVLARYAGIRGVTGLRELRARASFHQELSVARWLLHGVETHNREVIDDAVSMLDRLVDRLSHTGAPDQPRATLTEAEVHRLLDEVPDIGIDARSETAEFEALDEDREFLIEPEFSDTDEETFAHGGVSADAGASVDGDTSSDENTSVVEDQPTQPIDPADLPTPRRE